MISVILLFNIIIAVIHPLKYIPQIQHILETRSVNDLSLTYLYGETFINTTSLILFIEVSLNVHSLIYFIPTIFEKSLSLIANLYIVYLRHIFSNDTVLYLDDNNDIISDDEIWHDVLSNNSISDDEL